MLYCSQSLQHLVRFTIFFLYTVWYNDQGTTLEERFRSTVVWKLNAEEFVAIEKAVLQLWSLGICHCDLHGSNILLDTMRCKATIIDLGLAVAIPRRFRSLVRKRVLQVILLKQGHAGSAFDDLWFTDGIGAFAEAALLPQQNLNPITQEPIQEYNSDGDFLRKMYFYVRPTQLPNIPKARMKAWACGPRQK
jgi:serine/threonine protein kinase